MQSANADLQHFREYRAQRIQKMSPAQPPKLCIFFIQIIYD